MIAVVRFLHYIKKLHLRMSAQGSIPNALRGLNLPQPAVNHPQPQATKPQLPPPQQHQHQHLPAFQDAHHPHVATASLLTKPPAAPILAHKPTTTTTTTTKQSEPDEQWNRAYEERLNLINLWRENITGLERLYAVISSDMDNFDVEDVKFVQTLLDERRAYLNQLEQDLVSRVQCYENIVRTAKNKLGSRQRALQELENECRVLSKNDEVKNFFVQKHVELKKMVDDMCAQISS